MKQKIQAQMLAVATVVDDGGDARRAPKTVILAVFRYVSLICESLRDKKNTVNTAVFRLSRCFWRLAGQKPRYLRGVSTLGARITVFAVFFGQNQAKTPVFMQFQHVARNKFSMQKKKHKTL